MTAVFPVCQCSWKQIVYFIINHFQINKLKRVVHDIDGAAFISLQEVSDIIKISEPQ